MIKDAAERKNILRSYVWPNLFASGTYNDHVDSIKNYYSDRLDWMNAEVNTW